MNCFAEQRLRIYDDVMKTFAEGERKRALNKESTLGMLLSAIS
jgi:hypothetical protein